MGADWPFDALLSESSAMMFNEHGRFVAKVIQHDGKLDAGNEFSFDISIACI